MKKTEFSGWLAAELKAGRRPKKHRKYKEYPFNGGLRFFIDEMPKVTE